MPKRLFDTICIIKKYDNPELVSKETEAIIAFCKYDIEYGTIHGVHVIDEELCDERTLIIALGGDGTVMTACRLAANTGSMVLGINYGNLGFLTYFNVGDDIIDLLRNIMYLTPDEVRLQERFLLGSSISGEIGSFHGNTFAVNDFYISSDNGRVITYTLEINGNYAAEHAADGCIVCSSTGSTAYSLAAGGALMMPTLKAIQIVPVAPHMLTSRPLIVGEHHEVTVRVKATDHIRVMADGIPVYCEPHDGEYIIRVRISNKSVRLIRKSKDRRHNFFDTITEKLYYGRRGEE